MTDNEKLADIRSDIPFLKHGIYVDNASVSPVPDRVRKAAEKFNDIIAEQLRDAKELTKPVYDKGREFAGKLVGSSAANIAYVQNTSHGLSLVALGLDWREGDNVVICAQEFPSNYLCWIQLEQKGVEIRQVSSPDGTITPDLIAGVIDNRTRLVAVSHVQFYSGYKVDLAAIAELCSKSGALLVVDGTQSIGAVTVDVKASGVDVLVASAHKWMMGPRGIGFAHFSNRALEQIKPAIVGWLSVNDPFAFNRTLDYLPDARRFESGTPNGSGMFGLAERLAQLHELGPIWIENRILDLNQRVIEGVLKKGLKPVYQFERSRRSGISLLQRDGMSAPEILARLNANKIFASVRNGSIRIATHYYNTEDEIDQIVSVMSN